MIERLYLVSLIPLAYFGARLWMTKKKWVVVMLCLFLIASCPLHIIARYGNQVYDYVSSEQMEGLRYFHRNMPQGYVVGLDNPWLMKNLESYYYIPFDYLKWEDGNISEPIGEGVLPCRLIITRQDRAFYEYIRNEPEFVGEVEELLEGTENCWLIYDNPDFKIYEIEYVGDK